MIDHVLYRDGLGLTRNGTPVLIADGSWLEILHHRETDETGIAPAASVHLTHDGGSFLRGNTLPVSIAVAATTEPGSATDLVRVNITLVNESNVTQTLNMKWRLAIVGDAPTRWLVPGLVYKLAEQQYLGGHPSLIGEPSRDLMRSPWWTFRADLAAVPLVMAWNTHGSTAMVMNERVSGSMVGIGLDAHPAGAALVGCWPFREEPVARDPEAPREPIVTWASIEPYGTRDVFFYLTAGDDAPHAYAPVFRETFARWEANHSTEPRYLLADGAESAAIGLLAYHYDRDQGVLWETAAYDAYFGKNAQSVDRFEMHVAFTSGIPYAYAMISHGQRSGDETSIDAGRTVIDRCCDGIAPWGSFMTTYRKDEGWGGGWPAPQRAGGRIGGGTRDSADLQARTVAEATLFTARAVMADANAPRLDRWMDAVASNCRFVMERQRNDGNCGQAYSARDGSVLDWDGEEGLLWIAALIEAHRVFDDKRYLAAAVSAGAYYATAVDDAYLTGAPEAMHLLPTSECPQNAVISYVLLFEATGDLRWLDTAIKSFDLFMTFRWQYNTVFDPDSLLGRYDFHTKGMDVSSPNNIHLHPFGLIATPEALRLWHHTGDRYILKQTYNNIMACTQVLSWRDGVWNGRRGMSTERWAQTPGGLAKGMMMPLAHSWTTGVVLYAADALLRHGQTFLDEESGELLSVEPVTITSIARASATVAPSPTIGITTDEGRSCAWEVKNPSNADIYLELVTAKRDVVLSIGDRIVTAISDRPTRIVIPAASVVEVRVHPDRTNRTG